MAELTGAALTPNLLRASKSADFSLSFAIAVFFLLAPRFVR
jgi:hypothetical protein